LLLYIVQATSTLCQSIPDHAETQLDGQQRQEKRVVALDELIRHLLEHTMLKFRSAEL
jgi:hypothetical protein